MLCRRHWGRLQQLFALCQLMRNDHHISLCLPASCRRTDWTCCLHPVDAGFTMFCVFRASRSKFSVCPFYTVASVLSPSPNLEPKSGATSPTFVLNSPLSFFLFPKGIFVEGRLRQTLYEFLHLLRFYYLSHYYSIAWDRL